MAKIKTYGISGYIEYKAAIAVGKAHLSIHFQGGSISRNGTYPALYTSRNPMEQVIIENSPLYKQGRIITVSTIEVEDEPQQAVAEPAAEDKPLGNASGTVAAEVGTEAVASGTVADKDVKKFASLADAKEYLQQKGIDAEGIKFKADAIDLAKANGYEIDFYKK